MVCEFSQLPILQKPFLSLENNYNIDSNIKLDRNVKTVFEYLHFKYYDTSIHII